MYVPNHLPTLEIPSGLRQSFTQKFDLNVNNSVIVRMKNDGGLTERDVRISSFLFHFVFATAEQLYQLCEDESSLSNFKSRLDKLVRQHVLNSFILSSDIESTTPQDALLVYCLDVGGKHLLTQFSNLDTSDWLTTNNMRASEQVSKYLLISDIYLRLKRDLGPRLVEFNVQPELTANKKNYIPAFDFSVEAKNSDIKTYVCDIFLTDDFGGAIRERADKLDSLLNTQAWKKYYVKNEISTPPALLSFASNEDKALEVARALDSRRIAFRTSTFERILTKEIHEAGTFLKYENETFKEVRMTNFAP